MIKNVCHAMMAVNVCNDTEEKNKVFGEQKRQVPYVQVGVPTYLRVRVLVPAIPLWTSYI